MNRNEALGPDHSSTPWSSSFTVTSEMGVSAKVVLSDLSHLTTRRHQQGDSANGSSQHDNDHRLVISGTLTPRNRSTVDLTHEQMKGTIFAMAEDIELSRYGWLSLSCLRVRRCCHEDHAEGVTGPWFGPDLIWPKNVSLMILKSCRASEGQATSRSTGVQLEWIDSRAEIAVPLSDLLQETPLSHHIRDVVQQLSSRILNEALLRCPLSAQLFHRSWQQRRSQITPLIGSISASMRSLISRALLSTRGDAELQRLGVFRPLPSLITIENVFNQIDQSFNPASRASPADVTRRRRRQPAASFEGDRLDNYVFDEQAFESIFDVLEETPSSTSSSFEIGLGEASCESSMTSWDEDLGPLDDGDYRSLLDAVGTCPSPKDSLFGELDDAMFIIQQAAADLQDVAL